jgi:kumamolisin
MKKTKELIVLKDNARPVPSGARRVAEVDPTQKIEVTLDLKGPALPGVDALPDKPLSRKEFAAKYGTKKADADKIRKTLAEFGLKVIETSLANRSMRVTGTIAQMEAAFAPRLAIYQHPTEGQFRGRTGDLKIPKVLEGLILGVFGFDERRVGKRRRPLYPKNAAAPAVPADGLLPADLEKMYNFPPGDAGGQEIGIAEFGGGYFAQDLQAYCQAAGRPVPKVTVIPLNLQPVTLTQLQNMQKGKQQEEEDETLEVMMDIEVAAGLSPGANITVYFAPFTQKGWLDTIHACMNSKAVVLSASWGNPEEYAHRWSQAALNAINDRLQAAAMQGLTVCIAAGDDGTSDGMQDNNCHVDFPGSSPFCLSVGGTMVENGKEKTWWNSPGWRDPNISGSGATGGGVSVKFGRPSWQAVDVPSLNPGAIDGRVQPDISALAGNPNYYTWVFGRKIPDGGTSASTPLWAALIARVNALLPAAKQKRFLTKLLYSQLPSGKTLGQTACRDIVDGSNASNPYPGRGYRAGQGFDAVSGWGVPDGKALLDALTKI